MRIAAANSYGFAVYGARLKQVAAPPLEEGLLHFQSAGEVVEDILADDPQVIAFGEIHPRRLNQSMVGVFTAEILPSLAESGITDLVLEILFYDPAIEKNLAIFYKTGRLNSKETPALLANINLYVEACEIKELLYRARELGIRIRPGGLSPETAEETILQPDFSARDDLRLRAIGEITRHSLAHINFLLDQGRRIAVYSGRRHNDIHPSPADQVNGVNYGMSLSERLGEAYFEVDLMRGNNIRDPIQSDDVPQDGVNVLQDGNSYTLVFPQ
ncbi:hypothetical protein HZC35_02780 [Candidatus Saganbacteria bacterium]|nr:hypothetical protein [Candidatus Saganbacteria bacterium]